MVARAGSLALEVMSLREYLSASREARYSVTFALPLLLLYEGLTGLLPASALGDVRNGADVLLKTVFVALGGRNGVTAFGVLLLVRAQGNATIPGLLAAVPGMAPGFVTLVAGLLLTAGWCRWRDRRAGRRRSRRGPPTSPPGPPSPTSTGHRGPRRRASPPR